MRFLTALSTYLNGVAADCRRGAVSFRAALACRRVARGLSAYLDETLPRAERRAITVHLRGCCACDSRAQALRRTRGLLRSLPVETPPAALTASLRSMAGRESYRRKQSEIVRNPWAPLEAFVIRLRNQMRPLAIPIAGGLVSTLVLFSMLMPAYHIIPAHHIADVPTTLYTDPSVISIGPFGFSDDEMIVEVIIDEQGRVVECVFPDGPHDQRLRRQIENSLLFARFAPAMAFGQPTSGRLRLSFLRSRLDVKG
jgi:hypothetical protein